jgi:hypothetical protein
MNKILKYYEMRRDQGEASSFRYLRVRNEENRA